MYSILKVLVLIILASCSSLDHPGGFSVTADASQALSLCYQYQVLIVQTSHLNTQAWGKVNALLCHQISPYLDTSYIVSTVPVWSKHPAPVQTSQDQIHLSRSQSDQKKNDQKKDSWLLMYSNSSSKARWRGNSGASLIITETSKAMQDTVANISRSHTSQQLINIHSQLADFRTASCVPCNNACGKF